MKFVLHILCDFNGICADQQKAGRLQLRCRSSRAAHRTPRDAPKRPGDAQEPGGRGTLFLRWKYAMQLAPVGDGAGQMKRAIVLSKSGSRD